MNMLEKSDPPGASASQPTPAIRLGAWSFYFIAKLLLFWRGLIDFHPLENLAFAGLLLMPIASRAGRRIRAALAIPLAIALLYYDSWLPPFGRVLSQASLVSSFSLPYLLELAERFISWPVVALLVVAWAGYRIVAHVLRVGIIVLLLLIVLTLTLDRESGISATPATAADPGPRTQASASTDPEQALREFYATEAQRRITFASPDNAAPFDLIFIHVCSLSWADLQAARLDRHPIWNEFDFLFREFNSAASYSGPAAIRINRAACGQTPHNALYESASDQCYLLPSLKRSGFTPQLALNHDGHFDDFLPLVRKQGADMSAIPHHGVAVPLRAFDNSPVYDDFAMLSRWFDDRLKSPEPRVALFYNTISLHDGNRIVSGADAKLSSKDNYRPRVEKLLNDVLGFMEKVKKSGRRAVVVVIPEHGAALHGDRFQIAGLREIPTPLITMVPVGVKVIGPDATRMGSGAQITAPSSYFALAQLVARLIETSPYNAAGFDPSNYAADLPETDYVAENEGITMMRLHNRYWLKQGDEGWKEYRTGF